MFNYAYFPLMLPVHQFTHDVPGLPCNETGHPIFYYRVFWERYWHRIDFYTLEKAKEIAVTYTKNAYSDDHLYLASIPPHSKHLSVVSSRYIDPADKWYDNYSPPAKPHTNRKAFL